MTRVAEEVKTGYQNFVLFSFTGWLKKMVVNAYYSDLRLRILQRYVENLATTIMVYVTLYLIINEGVLYKVQPLTQVVDPDSKPLLFESEFYTKIFRVKAEQKL